MDMAFKVVHFHLRCECFLIYIRSLTIGIYLLTTHHSMYLNGHVYNRL